MIVSVHVTSLDWMTLVNHHDNERSKHQKKPYSHDPLHIDEVATWIRATQKKISLLVQSVLKHDTQLQTDVIKTCSTWGKTITNRKEN